MSLKPPLDQITWLIPLHRFEEFGFHQKGRWSLFNGEAARNWVSPGIIQAATSGVSTPIRVVGWIDTSICAFAGNHPMEHSRDNRRRIEKTSWLYIKPSSAKDRGCAVSAQEYQTKLA